jgi:hypothetical protein
MKIQTKIADFNIDCLRFDVSKRLKVLHIYLPNKITINETIVLVSSILGFTSKQTLAVKNSGRQKQITGEAINLADVETVIFWVEEVCDFINSYIGSEDEIDLVDSSFIFKRNDSSNI